MSSQEATRGCKHTSCTDALSFITAGRISSQWGTAAGRQIPYSCYAKLLASPSAAPGILSQDIAAACCVLGVGHVDGQQHHSRHFSRMRGVSWAAQAGLGQLCQVSCTRLHYHGCCGLTQLAGQAARADSGPVQGGIWPQPLASVRASASRPANPVCLMGVAGGGFRGGGQATGLGFRV